MNDDQHKQRLDNSLLYITWQRHAGRAEEIAASLGGKALHVHPKVPGGSRVLRYIVSSITTAVGLAGHRPDRVVVVNPPVVPGLLVWLYTRCRGRFVLDAHPGAFGAKSNAVSARLLPITRFLIRRAEAVMVTIPAFARQVNEWGGTGIIVHEAPPQHRLAVTRPQRSRSVVLFVCVFAPDEPLGSVLSASRLLPDLDFHITGDLRRAPSGVVSTAPDNVHFVGFLDAEQYADEMATADCVLSLTTDPSSVMRSAYEAVYAERPLVVSDWEALHDYFPHAEHAADDGRLLAEAITRALNQPTAKRKLARECQLQRWTDQKQELASILSGEAHPGQPQGAHD